MVQAQWAKNRGYRLVIRWLRWTTSRWRSATSTTRATPRGAASLAILAALFDRLGRHEPAATIAGFAFSPLTAAALPEIQAAIAHLAMSSAPRPTNRSPARVRR